METKGLIIVNTGNGKGKTTAAFGQLYRAIGGGFKCAVVQFIKKSISSEVLLLQEKFPEVPVHITGLGFTWNSEDLSKDTQSAQDGWELAKGYLSDSSVDLVVLDELTYPISYKMLDEDDVVTALKNRPQHQHVVITGRDVSTQIIALADTITTMEPTKHHFEEGIMAQKGVEF